MISVSKLLPFILYINIMFLFFCTISASEQQALDAERNAYFNKIYSDFGTDTNMNGLYDIITIEVGINVFTSGEYIVSGSLYDASGNEIINVTNRCHLDFGCRSVKLDFNGPRATGPHYLENLTLYDAHGNLIDHIDEAYVTRKTYYNLEYGPLTEAKLTGNYTDHGTDVSRDGLYDYLTIGAGVDVMVPGEYSLMAYLYDIKNKEVIWAIDHGNLSNGYHTMRLNFDGKSIKNHGISGPYHLENVTLFSGSSYTGLHICDYLRRAYATSAYNYSDFGI